MEKEYFNVSNKYLADGINFATRQQYYKFTTQEGKEVYAFLKTNAVLKSYKFLCDMRFGEK